VTGEIIVVVEQTQGTVKGTSLQAMTAGARLARERGAAAVALITEAGFADAAAALARHGAAKVVRLEVGPADTVGWASAVAGFARGSRPAAVLLSHTARGKDLGPRIAALLSAPMASDCTSLAVEGGAIVARRPVYAGKALVNVTGTGETLVATLRPNALAAEESPGAGTLEQATAAAPDRGLGAVLQEVLAAASKKIELTEASIIVSGGRGLKGPENFVLIEDLARELGAAVGASRAVVDAGWRPHSDQVGQTGKTVSPQLYIAVAISGAIQHLAGMRTSKYIVAINKDPEAPIFKVADYGIVGDAFEVVPRLTEAVKALKAHA
jgi:electron transfer flavoprotein alpha subunit